jgi:hypothetical protein
LAGLRSVNICDRLGVDDFLLMLFAKKADLVSAFFMGRLPEIEEQVE